MKGMVRVVGASAVPPVGFGGSSSGITTTTTSATGTARRPAVSREEQGRARSIPPPINVRSLSVRNRGKSDDATNSCRARSVQPATLAPSPRIQTATKLLDVVAEGRLSSPPNSPPADDGDGDYSTAVKSEDVVLIQRCGR